METRYIGGKDGLEVSLVGLGCNAFGTRIDEETTHSVINSAIDTGINFFDTAELYGDGRSETFIGSGLKNKRSKVFLASKFGFSKSHVKGRGRGSAENIKVALENTLKRLRTDCVDLYQIHRPDNDTPIAETLGALETLVESGKIRFYGCSYFSGTQLEKASNEAKANGLRGFVTAQNCWNLLERKVETDLIPVCDRYDVKMIPYYPIAKGLLTGKYRRGLKAPTGSRLEGEADLANANYECLEKLESYARDNGYDLLTLAISWLATHSVTASIIVGGTRSEQMPANALASSWKMSTTNLREIDSLLND